MMEFKTFEQYKQDYNFGFIEEVRVLKRVKELTNSYGLQLLAQQSIDNLTNSNRPKSHIDFFMEVQYVGYINCLLNLDITKSFDNIFDVLFKYGWKIESLDIIKGELQL